jgi:hypothetical protein
MIELRERVAAVIADVEYPRLPPRAEHYEMADAAIALVLEEAAKVADDEAYGFPPEMLTKHGVGYERACRDIAAAIRAMKGSPWKCPINHTGCTSNCGSYGCGN